MNKKIHTLHYLSVDDEKESHAEQIYSICLAGVRCIQLRIKNKPKKEILPIAKEAREICTSFGAQLIINDFPEIAAAVGADGLHLGKEDISICEARKIVGDACMIGGSANAIEDLISISESGANYIGLGPLRYTATKKNLSSTLGFGGIRMIMQQFQTKKYNIPVIAIGGIVATDIPELMNIGFHGAAVSGALFHSKNRRDVFLEFQKFQKQKDKKAEPKL